MPLTGVGSLLLSGVCGAFGGLRVWVRGRWRGEGDMDTAAIARCWLLLPVCVCWAGGPFLCRGPSALTPPFLSTAGNHTVNHLNSPLYPSSNCAEPRV